MSISQNNNRFNIWMPLLIAAVLAAGMALGFKMQQASGNAMASYNSHQPAKHIEELVRYIDAKYVDSVDTEEITTKAINAILKELDPHSNYISPSQIASVQEDLEGNFEGVGIQFVLQEDTIYVVNAIEGGPSEKIGIRAGDKIIEIEDSVVAGVGLASEGVVDKLKGGKGTKVRIKIKRYGEKELLPFTIERATVQLYSVDAAYMVNENTGYIKINRFSATTAQEFVQKVEDFEDKGMKNLVIDLRQNPGGYFNAATRILDQLFKDTELMVYTKGLHYKKSEYKSSGRSFFNIEDVALLIDEGSASASEIMAGAIQDSDRGIIVGRRSFGKGLVQEQYKLSNGGALRLTVARYYTPSGRSIQKPYSTDRQSYNYEMYDRYDSGELNSKDSIQIQDTTKYYTRNNRVVYGGGGITPDFFVPIDKVVDNEYYIKANQYIAPYVYNYLDTHREEYKQYKTIKQFIENVKVSEKMMSEFTLYATEEGVVMNEKLYTEAKGEIKNLIKAFIGRQFFGNEGFYQVINHDDKMIKKALKEMK